MRLGLGIGLGRLQRSSIDPAAAAYFAATGITGATEKAAINTLVTSLKSAGLWSKMKAVYPFVTDNRNLLSYTEDFGNAYWTKNNSTVTTNSTTAPDGTTTADKITIDLSNNEHIVWNNSGYVSTAGTFTSSVYIKKGNSDYIQVANNGANSPNYAYIVVNVNNGAVTQSGASGSYTLNSYAVTSVGNGWYRCSITYTTTSDESRGLRVRFSNSATPTIGAYGTITFTGNGTDFFYIWGGQFENGSLTTYQPIATTQQSYISNQFKYNLVNPVDSDAAFRGVFNGGWTFSNQGATPNGTNGYMDTKLVPSAQLTLNSSHFSYYSRTNNQSDGFLGTAGGPTFNGSQLYLRGLYYLNEIHAAIGKTIGDSTLQNIIASNTNSQGFYTIKRTSDISSALFKNGVSIGTNTTQTSGSFNSWAFMIGARNNNNVAGNYDNRQVAFASIGDGLTDTEATALYNAVQTMNITLNRQV